MDKETALLWILAREHLWDLLPPGLRSQGPARLDQARTILRDEAPEWHDWPEHVAPIATSERLLQPPKVDPVVHECVLHALERGRQLEIDYQAYDPRFRPDSARRRSFATCDSRSPRHRIHPLGLVKRDQVFYLVSRFYEYEDVRLLALHRITGASMLERPVQPPAAFTGLREYIAAGHLNFLDEARRLTLHLRFHESCYQSLWERPLQGENMTMTEPRDGVFEVRGTVADSWALRWWLLGFGDRVEILQPESLRQEVNNLRFDQVTGLRVRRALDEEIERLIAQAERSGRPLSLLMLDLDDFGKFNKQYGTRAGDQVLGHVGDLLRQEIRATDVAGRYGGEEFVVALPDTPLDEARRIAERIRRTLATTPCEFEDDSGRPYKGTITTCIGVAQYARQTGRDRLYSQASEKLRQAKRSKNKDQVAG